MVFLSVCVCPSMSVCEPAQCFTDLGVATIPRYVRARARYRSCVGAFLSYNTCISDIILHTSIPV